MCHHPCWGSLCEDDNLRVLTSYTVYCRHQVQKKLGAFWQPKGHKAEKVIAIVGTLTDQLHAVAREFQLFDWIDLSWAVIAASFANWLART